LNAGAVNPRLDRLQPYPFERLRSLLAGIDPPADRKPIPLQIGEPKHSPPAAVLAELASRLAGLGSYPTTLGVTELREAIADWLERRYRLPHGRVNRETMVIPLAGTREGLFAVAQALLDPQSRPLVAMPNPFYQIYEGAALLAGGEPLYLPATAMTGHLPDLDAVPDSTWARCGLLYLCSPANPSGAVATLDYLQHALQLAARHGFTIAADECYAEIYADELAPPAGILQAALAAGHDGFEHCLAFHSLSKRSSLPGLRSGFVAGDARLLAAFARYRTYHGCALPLPTQYASVLAWRDEAHVLENRALYRAKFDAVLPVLRDTCPVERPAGAFYLWLPVGDDREFTRRLYAEEHVTVLPGSFLSRGGAGGDPGAGHVRVSLVATQAECIEAAHRLRRCLATTASSALASSTPVRS
jgi:N-succinyldiaminopimelate aminotransferase